MKVLFITDKQVAAVLGVSVDTVRAHADSISKLPNGIRLSDAEPFYIGNSRRWNPARLAKLLGVTAEEIVNALGGM